MKPELGHNLVITKYLKRVTKWEGGKLVEFRQRMKVWDEVELKEPKTVKVIGLRTLSNGRIDYDSEAGNMYTPKKFFQAWLVVESLSKKPYHVPYTQLFDF